MLFSVSVFFHHFASLRTFQERDERLGGLIADPAAKQNCVLPNGIVEVRGYDPPRPARTRYYLRQRDESDFSVAGIHELECLSDVGALCDFACQRLVKSEFFHRFDRRRAVRSNRGIGYSDLVELSIAQS
jgi:hypothetical protein